MTVGIAAIAEGGKAIVFCADRLLTTEDGTRSLGAIAKKRSIGYGWHPLFEDNHQRADDLRDEVRLLIQSEQASRSTPMTDLEMRRTVQKAFRKLREDAMPHLGRGKRFDLGILLLGFDENNEAAGYCFDDKGELQSIRQSGHAAIGLGGYVADCTLAHYDTIVNERLDAPLDHVLYKVWEAKRRADECESTVGSDVTDLWIITEHAKRQEDGTPQAYPPHIVFVPDWVTDVLDKTYAWHTAAPWMTTPEPVIWSSMLSRYAQDVVQGRNPQ